MKRTLAILLCLGLLLGCLPLSAAAKELSVKDKFLMLLNDMELDPKIYQPDRYHYEELAQYPQDDPEWVLIRAGLTDIRLEHGETAHHGTLGNKHIVSSGISSPFSFDFGVYDVKKNAFYDLADAWSMDFKELRTVWNNLPGDLHEDGLAAYKHLIGDADNDGEITILDATRVQRILAELEAQDWDLTHVWDWWDLGVRLGAECDYDRDGELTILDATKLQRGIAELPNVLDARELWDERIFPDVEPGYACELINSRDELDPKDEYHQKALEACDEAFFTENSLVLVKYSLSSGALSLTFRNAALDQDGVLNVNFDCVLPHTQTDDINGRFIGIGVSKAFVDDIRDLKVNVNKIRQKPIEDMIVNVVDYNRAQPRPADAEAQGYRFIESERMFSGSFNFELSPAYEAVMGESETGGCIAVLKTPEHFSEFFTEKTLNRLGIKASDYDAAFFKNNVLAVAAHITYTYSVKTYLSHLAVKGNTLYGELDWYEPIVDAEALNIAFDVLKIKRSDVEAVTKTAIWDDRMYSRNFLWNVFYGQEPPQRDPYTAEDQFRKLTPADTVLYTDTEFSLFPYFYPNDEPCAVLIYNPVQRDQMVRNLIPDTDSFEDYAYLLFSSNGSDLRVTELYTDGEVLELFVSEEEPAVVTMSENSIQILKLKKSDLAGIIYMKIWKDSSVTDEKAKIVLDYGTRDHGGSPVGQLITDRGELDAFASKYMGSSAKRDIEGKYYDGFFKNYSLIGAYVSLGSGGLSLSLDSVELVGGVCKLNLLMTSEYSVIDAAMNPRVVLVSVCKQNFPAESIDTVEVNVAWGGLNGSLYTEINREESRPLKSKVEASAASCRSLDAETADVQTVSGFPYYFDWYDLPLAETDIGYVMLIRSRAEFEYYLPRFDQAGEYDDAFFKDYALVVMLAQGSEGTAQAELDDLAVVDGALYVNPWISYHYHTEPDGTVALQPVAPSVCTFRKVAKSDVMNVTRIDLWTTKTDFTIIPSVIERYRPELSFDESAAAVLIKDESQVKDALDFITNADYYGENAIDHTFKIERWGDEQFALNDVIAVRAYQGSSDTVLQLDSVQKYADRLVVRMTRRYPNTPAVPDNVWQMIFLRIPKLSEQLPVEVEINSTLTAEPIVQSMTDDKKRSTPYGYECEFENLHTSCMSFMRDYNAFGDGTAFLSQPYKVAIVRTYEQYKNLYSTLRLSACDYKPHIFNTDGSELDESFFEDSALIVGAAPYQLAEEYLSFDRINASGGFIEVGFNHYTYHDLHPDEDYAANILGYCFAAAKVPKERVGQAWDIFMLPEVKKLPE